MDEQKPQDDAVRRATTPETTAERAVPATTATRAPRKRRWGVTLFGIFVILPILLVALWTTVALNWSYSSGERAGPFVRFMPHS